MKNIEQLTDEQLARMIKWQHTARLVGAVLVLALIGLLKVLAIV